MIGFSHSIVAVLIFVLIISVSNIPTIYTQSSNQSSNLSEAYTAIAEIEKQLGPSLLKNETGALHGVLINIVIGTLGSTITPKVMMLISNHVHKEGNDGPLSQSLISLARHMKGSAESSRLGIKIYRDWKNGGRENDTILTVLQSATAVAGKGSNDTNKEIEKITSLITQKNATLIMPSQLVLYQIVIQIDGKGGNMTKAIHRIESAITQNPAMVSLQHLPMVQSLNKLAQLITSNNVNVVNRIIDNATTQAARGNEDMIDRFLIQQTQNYTK